MAAKQSAGILVYRSKDDAVEVLLAHSGGPFWAKKDRGAWSIPKGEFEDGEKPIEVAKREFHEEIGQELPVGELFDLGTIKQKNGKTVYGWAVEGNIDVSKITSNTFSMEWPPKSGQQQEFPEVDRAEWFEIGQAADKLRTGQDAFLGRLAEHIGIEFVKPEQASLF